MRVRNLYVDLAEELSHGECSVKGQLLSSPSCPLSLRPRLYGRGSQEFLPRLKGTLASLGCMLSTRLGSCIFKNLSALL